MKIIKYSIVLFACIVFISCFILQMRPSSAGIGITATWSGNGADSNWSTNNNWAPPAPPPADSDVVFPAGANRLSNNNDLTAGMAFATLTFNGAGGGYNLSGNNFGINERITASNTAGDNTINNDIQITDSIPFTSTTAGTTLTLAGDLDLNGETLTVTGSGDLVIGGVISGLAGGITKNGTGTLQLSSDNTYDGETIINNGELFLDGCDIAESSVTVEGGMVSGTGTTGALNSPGGTISPGTSIGSINISGNLTLGLNSSLDVEINGETAGTDYDQLVVTGTVQLDGGALNVTFGITPEAGDSFVIISNDGTDAVTGAFNGFAQGTPITVDSVPVVINYAGGDSNDVTLDVVTLSIDNIEVTEGDAGIDADAIFTVSLSAPTQNTVTVEYVTADGTAKAPGDYTAQSGILTFNALEQTKTITIAVVGDLEQEDDETFTVTLSNPTNALIGSSAVGACTIHHASGSGGCGCIISNELINTRDLIIKIGGAIAVIVILFSVVLFVRKMTRDRRDGLC